MKPKQKIFKSLAVLLSILVLLQSCIAYNGLPTPVDKAVLSPKKVKVLLSNNHIYKFKRIGKDNDQIYGIAKRNSEAAMHLSKQVVPLEKSKRLVRVNLKNEQVKEIYVLNEQHSVLQTISLILLVGVPLVIGVIEAAGGDTGCCY
jgi:hypothetical protein